MSKRSYECLITLGLYQTCSKYTSKADGPMFQIRNSYRPRLWHDRMNPSCTMCTVGNGNIKSLLVHCTLLLTLIHCFKLFNNIQTLWQQQQLRWAAVLHNMISVLGGCDDLQQPVWSCFFFTNSSHFVCIPGLHFMFSSLYLCQLFDTIINKNLKYESLDGVSLTT